MSQDKHRAHVNVHIEGDVSGQIAIGDNILQIGAVHGGVVNIIQPDKKPTFSQRPRPVMIRPRKFPGFLNHLAEMGTVVGALNEGESVSVYAQDGMGKTSLLRQLAYHAPGDAFPDGILYFPAHIKNVDDLLQIVFDHFFETDSLAKPTDAELCRFLQAVQALILLDDVLLSKDEVVELINAVPQSAFILASSERCLWGEGFCIELQGLPLQEALALIERELKRVISPSERSCAETLCQIGNGRPLFLIQAAALVRQGNSFEEVVHALRVAEGGFGKVVAGKLNEAQRAILGLMNEFIDIAIPRQHLAQLAGTKDIKTHLETLKDMGLVKEHGSAVSLAGALVLPLPMRQAFASGWEARSLDYFVQWIWKAPPVAEIGEALDLILSLLERAILAGRWEAVITLGRGIESTLVLNKRWQAWLQVLGWIFEAARALNDQAMQAWALHQLGARSLCLGDLAAAQEALTQALGIREALGDQAGAAVTRQTLELTAAPPPAQPATAPEGGLSPLLKAVFIVAGIAVIAAAVLFLGPPSQPPSESPTPVPQAPREAPVIAPLPLPEESPVPTSMPSPASTVEITATSAPVNCTFDMDFVTARQMQYEVALGFDVPFEIPYETMNINNRDVDLGENLTLFVNSNEVTDYRTGLYDAKRPDRLFVLLPEFHRDDTIQVQLWDNKALHCSPVVPVDWIDPYVEPPKAEPAETEEPAACVPQSCGEMSIWNPALCCCEYSPGYCE